jgi:hypothetical protein
LLETLAWGCFGGLLAELLGLYDLRERDEAELPSFLKSAFYWSVTLLMIAAGGGLAVAYNASQAISAMVAVNIGASAPLILRQFKRSTPPVEPGTTG